MVIERIKACGFDREYEIKKGNQNTSIQTIEEDRAEKIVIPAALSC